MEAVILMYCWCFCGFERLPEELMPSGYGVDAE